MPKYAELIYNGFWFSPEREALQQLIDRTQEFVTGTVRLKLYKVRQGTCPGGGWVACFVGLTTGCQGEASPLAPSDCGIATLNKIALLDQLPVQSQCAA